MVTVLEPGLSKQLQTAIDAGDANTFGQLMAENNVHGASFLYASNRKNAYPLLNRALQGFTNKNFTGKFKIAGMLFSAGATAIPGAPYGLSPLKLLLHEHRFLRTTPAKFEIYEFTLFYAYELVAKHGADVNFRGKSQYYVSLLDDVVLLYEFYEKKGAAELQRDTYRLAEAMLEHGAQMEMGSHREDELAKSSIYGLLTHYRDNATAYVAPPLTLPDFSAWPNVAAAQKAQQLWDEDTQKTRALKAVASLQERAYLHANWGFERPEAKALALLEAEFEKLEKAAKKQAMADLKKLQVPQKDLLKNKSAYELKRFEEKKELLPMKPCYDDAVYNRLYETVVNQVG